MHMTLNYNLGMSEQVGDRLLVRVISLLLIFTILFSSVTEARRIVVEEITHGLEAVDDWVFPKVTDYRKETWDQRVNRLMNANIQNAGGISAAVVDRDVRCLAENVYYESRGEPLKGQLAVAKVTLNRLDEGYAKSICGVVKQQHSNVCQFSWVCNSTLTRPAGLAWTQAVGIALVALNEPTRVEDPTNGATYFHATYIEWQPGWRKVQESVRQIGNHVFYRTKPKRN
jgi:spore germination cell wall hydrolase CwlJ-like protein